MTIKPLRNPLILALDLDDQFQIDKLVDEVGEIVGGIKIGPRLMLRFGPQIIKKMALRAPIFLDMKFFDIPSTMLSAVRAAFDIGAQLVTVHAQAGSFALEQLAQLELEYQKTAEVRILCVTMLTSFDLNTIPKILKNQSIEQHVIELGHLVNQAGLKGLVCSPLEIQALKKINDFYLVTPGIRAQVNHDEDQKRTLSAREAINFGATALVVGRPILEAISPRAACENLLASL